MWQHILCGKCDKKCDTKCDKTHDKKLRRNMWQKCVDKCYKQILWKSENIFYVIKLRKNVTKSNL